MHYTMQGYRVIALAQRQLRRMSYVKVQRAQRDDLERQLSFLGQWTRLRMCTRRLDGHSLSLDVAVHSYRQTCRFIDVTCARAT